MRRPTAREGAVFGLATAFLIVGFFSLPFTDEVASVPLVGPLVAPAFGFEIPNAQATFSFSISQNVTKTVLVPAHNITITINGQAGQQLSVPAINQTEVVRSFSVGSCQVTIFGKGLSINNDLTMDVLLVTPESLAKNLTGATLLFHPYFGLAYPAAYDELGFRRFANIQLFNSSTVVVNGTELTKWKGTGQVEYFLYGTFGAQLAADNMLITNGTGQLQRVNTVGVAGNIIQIGGPDVTAALTTDELTIALTWFILGFAVLEFRPEKRSSQGQRGQNEEPAKSKGGNDNQGRALKKRGVEHEERKTDVGNQSKEAGISSPMKPYSEVSEVGSQSVHLQDNGLYSAIGEVEDIRRKLVEGGFYAEDVMPTSEREAVNATLANVEESLRDLREGKDTTRRIQERMGWLRDHAKTVYDALTRDPVLRRLTSE